MENMDFITGIFDDSNNSSLSDLPIFPEQPKRDRKFRFRVKPRSQKYPEIFNDKIMRSVIVLYRWVRSDMFKPVIPITELHDSLFLIKNYKRQTIDQPQIGHNISKKQLGSIILETITEYNPRIFIAATKNNDLEKNTSHYRFHNKEDLQYGLEWMIVAWLRHIAEDVESELDEIATCPAQDINSIFLNPIKELESMGDWEEMKQDSLKIINDSLSEQSHI